VHEADVLVRTLLDRPGAGDAAVAAAAGDGDRGNRAVSEVARTHGCRGRQHRAPRRWPPLRVAGAGADEQVGDR